MEKGSCTDRRMGWRKKKTASVELAAMSTNV